jgi:putative transposase
VIHRGNNRVSTFGDDTDFEVFLALLEKAASRRCVSVHGFALMSNHYHLLLTPGDAQALPRMMQDVGARYVRHFNDRYERSGTLWMGRYRSIPVTDERYWLTCLRYIEQNPVRARMIDRAEEYPWSSYRVHALGDSPGWLAQHAVYQALGRSEQERAEAYRAICDAELTEAELVRQRLGVGRAMDQLAGAGF